jgi:2,3-bisphosphoglycerate-independent phosphoglycerate mutase
MDRDKRWERIKIAYDLLVHGQGRPIRNIQEAIAQSYAEGISDEFLKPLLCTDASGKAVATIADGDIVLCFNFRTDRGRQLTEALTQRDFHEQNMHQLDLDYLTLTNYDESFAGIQVLFEKDNLHNTLGEVIAKLPSSFREAARRPFHSKSVSSALRPKWLLTTYNPK